MLIVQHRRQVVHRHHRHVGLGEQVDPFRSAARLEDARELGIDDVDVGGTAGKARKFRIGAQIVAARRLEEVLPLLVVVDDDAEIAVRCLVGPAVAREVAGVAALVERRLKSEPAHVVAHDEAGHGLEHRDVDALAASGAVAVHEAGADRADGGEADNAIDQRVRHIARHAVTGLRHQRRQRGRALDQIVIGGLCGIRPVLTEAEHASIDQMRIDLGHNVIAELEPCHRLRTDVVDEHIGVLQQPQHGLAAGGLLQIETDRALAAVGVEEHRAHAGVTHRADQAGDVAVERFHLDDVSTVVAEHLGRIGPHQHGCHVDDLDALQGPHWFAPDCAGL
ncbi:hypothetical protein ACVW1A_006008 [Bradyrhizobium sp. LB1.3]